MAKPALKSVKDFAKQVIHWKCRSDDEHKQKLTAALYDYGRVQAKANELTKNQ